MNRLRPRHLWFRLAVVVGSLLGLLLLVQSIATYYQVSRFLIAAELRREAQQQVNALEREARRLGVRDPVELGGMLREIRQEVPEKLAWIRVVDAEGRTLIQEGTAVGPPLSRERLRSAFEQGVPAIEFRETEGGKELVSGFPLRLARRPPLDTKRPDLPPAPRPSPRSSKSPSTSPAPPPTMAAC